MPTGSLHESLSPREFAAVMDAAKRRAVELRREAFDNVWSAPARLARRARLALSAIRHQPHQET